MERFNSQKVIDGLIQKVKEAKRKGLREVKMNVDELDDIGYVIYLLMSEKMSDIIGNIDMSQNKDMNGGGW